MRAAVRERWGEVAAFALLTAVGAAVAASSFSYGVMDDGGRVGPGFMPLVLGALLFALGGGQLVGRLRSAAAQRHEVPSLPSGESGPADDATRSVRIGERVTPRVERPAAGAASGAPSGASAADRATDPTADPTSDDSPTDPTADPATVPAADPAAGPAAGAADPSQPDGDVDSMGRTQAYRIRQLWTVAAAILVGILLVPYVGFLIAFGALVLFISIVVEQRPWLGAVVITAAAVAVVYGVFGVFLNVPLPTGLIDLTLGS